MGTIVVGLDSSPQSKEALRWAAAEARLRRGRLLVVYALADDQRVGTGGGPVRLVEDPKQLQQHAEQLVDETVREVLGSQADVRIERLVRRGSPTDLLLEAAQSADLLVVGSRGLGGFRGMLMGSVSQQCAQRAPCPVVIVRGEAATGEASPGP